jgi:hypothetical protein
MWEPSQSGNCKGIEVKPWVEERGEVTTYNFAERDSLLERITSGRSFPLDPCRAFSEDSQRDQRGSLSSEQYDVLDLEKSLLQVKMLR